jgi:hypothetical protein
MKKYFVNSFYGDRIGLPNVYPNMYIGLFRECKAKGEGNCCGYYGAEYYLDTELIAYYEAEGPTYQPEKRNGVASLVNYKFDKFQIGSHMWTQVIEAKDDAEARDKFIRAEWRQWDTFKDEPRTVQEVISRSTDGHDFRHVIVEINDGNREYIYIDYDVDNIPDNILNSVVASVIETCNYGMGTLKLDILI